MEAINILGQTVSDRLRRHFLAERAKKSVPDNEYAGVIAIEIPHVGGVVHPVMRGAVEEPFKPAGHAINGLGVQPELIDQADAHHGHDHHRVKAQQRQRAPEQILQDPLAHALTKGRAVVVILRVVVRHMSLPRENGLHGWRGESCSRSSRRGRRG